MAARKTAKDEASTVDTLEQIRRWPTRSIVASRLGITRQGVSKMVERGELHPINDERGHAHFDPEEVDALCAEKGDQAITVSHLLNSTNDLIKQAHSHIGTLLEPSSVLLDNLAKENGALREENSTLRTKNFEMLEAHEQMLSEAQDRELMRNEFERTQERRDQVMNLFMASAPKLIDQIGLGRNMGPLKDLLSSLNEEQMQALEAVEFFNKEQMDALKKAHKMFASQKKEAPTEESGPRHEETKAVSESSEEKS